MRSRAFGKVAAVLFADFRGRLIIEKRQECIAAAANHRRDGMEKRARKYDRATDWRLETAWAIFREAQFAALVVVVEIDGDGKPAVRGAHHGIVPMGLEMATVLGGITADDIALHARDLEMVDLCNLGGEPPDKTRLCFKDDVLIF